ncbi:MAG: hypothetical protein OHK0038_14890 [Flammeovirgaceae bacterium]
MFNVPFVLAQESDVIEDPLDKPKEWAAVSNNPKNDKLWEKYFGKDLFSLNKEENLMFNNLKQYLLNKEKAITDKQDYEVMLRKTQSRYKKFENFTKAQYNELVQNVNKNFPIIEDYFAYQYELLGEKYVTYQDAYPTGEITKQEWIEEQELKIEELKKVHSLKNPK